MTCTPKNKLCTMHPMNYFRGSIIGMVPITVLGKTAGHTYAKHCRIKPY